MSVRPIEITMTQTRKINLGNYENIDLFCAVKMELTEGSMAELKEAYGSMKRNLDRYMNEWQSTYPSAPPRK